MNSRMSKYDNINNEESRVKRNQAKYDNLNKNDYEKFNVLSNATVIGENKRNEIDINKIKKILDNKYNDSQKRKSIRLDDEYESKYSDPEIENTKEYDINTILNKARSEKVINYEEDRLKKIRDTQYNILNNLTLESEVVDSKSEEKANLMNLINTITINEKKSGVFEESENSAIDLFAELKSSGKTEVVEPISNDSTVINSIENIKKDEKTSTDIDVKNEFYTSSTKFDKNDFADLEIDEKGGKNVITIIIVIIILLAFIIGMYLFASSILNF